MSKAFQGSTGAKITIPAHTIVSWSLVSQSSQAQTMQIKDPKGNLVVNTTVLSGSLTNTSIGTFSVNAEGDYTIFFPNRVVVYDSTTLNNARSIISETFLFGAEDGADADYNDAFAVLTWFGRTG